MAGPSRQEIEQVKRLSEKDLQMTIKWKENTLIIPAQLIWQVGGVPSKLTWEARGLTGHDGSHKKREELKDAKARAQLYVRTQEGYAKLHAIMQESSGLMEKLVTSPSETLDNYLPDKRFEFVIGIFRSGGTYFFDQLKVIHGQEPESYPVYMTHDSLPTPTPLVLWNRRWSQKLQLVFELALWLNWVKRECKDDKVIVHKSIFSALCLALLNDLFGERATYNITVRHPGPVAESFRRVLGEPLERAKTSKSPCPNGWVHFVTHTTDITFKEFQSWNFFRRAFVLWREYYQEIVKVPLHGKLRPIGFSEVSSSLEQLAEDVGCEGYQAKGFRLSPKDYAEHWPAEKETHEMIEGVGSFWAEKGQEFPRFPLQ